MFLCKVVIVIILLHYRVVTLVADKLKTLVRLYITNCIRQPQRKPPRVLSYNHDLAVCNHRERGHTSPACIKEHAITTMILQI